MGQDKRENVLSSDLFNINWSRGACVVTGKAFCCWCLSGF
jgi:hypothetical protein